MEKSPLLGGGGGVGANASTSSAISASSAQSAASSNSSVDADGAPTTTKSINGLGSFSLLINNLIGPAMLGFPNLFRRAGLVPTVISIVFIYLCASLSGTLLADAVSSIPGNRTYSRNIDFSTAFRIVLGEDWYLFAETLFLISCGVQAFASIVETAQSLDGFLAS